ncbi:MAG: hypothetical protein GY835_03165 [bacterium]|nr:hypothetical protein [bacterium]
MADSHAVQKSHLPMKVEKSSDILQSTDPNTFAAFLDQSQEGILTKIMSAEVIARAKRDAIRVQAEEQLRMMRLAFDACFRSGETKAESLISSERLNAVQDITNLYQDRVDDAVNSYCVRKAELDEKIANNKLPAALAKNLLERIDRELEEELDSLKELVNKFREKMSAG